MSIARGPSHHRITTACGFCAGAFPGPVDVRWAVRLRQMGCFGGLSTGRLAGRKTRAIIVTIRSISDFPQSRLNTRSARSLCGETNRRCIGCTQRRNWRRIELIERPRVARSLAMRRLSRVVAALSRKTPKETNRRMDGRRRTHKPSIKTTGVGWMVLSFGRRECVLKSYEGARAGRSAKRLLSTRSKSGPSMARGWSKLIWERRAAGR